MRNLGTMSTIAENIRRLMREKGVLQEDLARETGMRQPAISRLLTNPDANPTIDTLNSIATALGVETCDLLQKTLKKIAC